MPSLPKMECLDAEWRQNYERDLVSVIIPTYNRAGVVVNAVASALSQSWPKVQVIVIDDGSKDGTATVLEGIPGITVIHQSNQGVASARTAGLAVARGEYIASLDSDDVWHPGFLSTVIGLMRENGCDAGVAARERRVEGQLLPVRATPMECKFIPASAPFILLNPLELRALAMASVLSPNPGVVFHRRIMEAWPIRLRTIDDIGQHMRVILSHAPGAVFVTSPQWEVSPHGQDEFSIVGRNSRTDLGWRSYHELGVIEKESQSQLSRQERRVFARKRADWLAGDSAYPLSLNGRIFPALKAYFYALITDFRVGRCMGLVRGVARAVMMRRASRHSRMVSHTPSSISS